MTDPIQALTRRIKAIEEAQKRASRTPQLTRSSIDNGAVNMRDADGQLTGVLGRQWDGTFGSVTVAGPTPPIPDGLTMETVIGGVRLTLDGSFRDPQPGFTSPVVAPMDFRHFEIQVSESVDFPTGPTTRGGLHVASEAGGSVFVPWAAHTPLFARAVAWSTAGKFSAPSLTVGPVTSGAVGLGDLGFDLADYSGGTTIHYGPAVPTDPLIGDVWYAEVGSDDDGNTLHESRRWTGAEWAVLRDQSVNDAIVQAIAAQQAADTKARLFVQDAAPAWSGAAGSALWVDTANDNVTKTWTGTEFAVRRLGNGAIEPNSLVASDVIATGTVTAALLEAEMVLSTAFIAARQGSDTQTRLDPDGLAAYADDPVDGTPNEIARFGAHSSGRDPATGVITWSIDDKGRAAYEEVYAKKFRLAGTDLNDIINRFPRGIAARTVAGSTVTGISARVGIAELAVNVEAGRSYRVAWTARMTADVTDAEQNISIRNGGAGTPTVSSTVLQQWYMSSGPAFRWADFAQERIWHPGTTGLNRLLFCIQRGVGEGLVGINLHSFYVEDLGLAVPDTGVPSNGGGTSEGGTPPPPPTTEKVRKTETLEMNWSRSWVQSGAYRTDVGSSMYQGQTPYYTAAGIQAGAFAWHDLTGALSGATIEKVELYMYCEHSHYNNGMTVRMGGHGVKDLPATMPVQFPTRDVFFGKGSGQWIDITSWGADIKSGAVRGVALYANTTDPQFYGRISGVGVPTRPQIRITYVK